MRRSGTRVSIGARHTPVSVRAANARAAGAPATFGAAALSTRGTVSGMIPFSSVDGPGNRFTVFLQGCNFDCIACHNPYTINLCNDCGECVAHCPSGALSMVEGRVQWASATCTGNEACLAWCPYDSTPKAQVLEVAEVMARIRSAARYLSGVTVSGGEATQQPRFVHDLFAALRDDPELGRLSRFVDSNGSTPAHVWDDLDDVMDAAMIDLKSFDDDLHRTMTGQPNADVLRSIRQLAARGKLHEVRLLILPGVNDGAEMLQRTARWLADVDPAMRVKVIGFRCHGVRPIEPPVADATAEDLARVAAILRDAGLDDLVLV